MKEGIELAEEHLKTLPEGHPDRISLEKWVEEGRRRIVRPFSESATRDLERAGLIVVDFRTLYGGRTTLRDLLNAEPDAFNNTASILRLGRVLNVLSQGSQIAIPLDPQELLLADSFGLDFDGHEARLEEHRESMRTKLGGSTEFDFGEVSDHAGLALMYNGMAVQPYKGLWTRTNTPLNIINRIQLGVNSTGGDILITDTSTSVGVSNFGIAPIGIPAQQ